MAHNRIMRAEQELLQKGRIGQSLTAQQLKALMGQPEFAATVSEFRRQLDHVNQAEIQRFDSVLAAAIEQIQRDVPHESPNIDIVSLEYSNSCEVWAYNWDCPDYVVLCSVGGNVLLPSSRKVAKRFSYIYVMLNGRIVAWVSLER